jgi:uncharacterized protein
MLAEVAISKIRQLERDLKGMGVLSLSLFGSVARNEGRADSDVDVAVTVDYEGGFSLLDLVAVQNRLADHLRQPVDILTEPIRDPELKKNVEKDRVRAF